MFPISIRNHDDFAVSVWPFLAHVWRDAEINSQFFYLSWTGLWSNAPAPLDTNLAHAAFKYRRATDIIAARLCSKRYASKSCMYLSPPFIAYNIPKGSSEEVRPITVGFGGGCPKFRIYLYTDGWRLPHELTLLVVGIRYDVSSEYLEASQSKRGKNVTIINTNKLRY